MSINVLDLNGRFIKNLNSKFYGEVIELGLEGLGKGLHILLINKGDQIFIGKIEIE